MKCGGCGGEAHKAIDRGDVWVECTHGCGWVSRAELAIPKLSDLAASGGLDRALAALADAIDITNDIGKLHGFVEEVEVVVAAARLRAETNSAEAAISKLQRLALYAQQRQGQLLATLEGGGRGKPKSPRAKAAEAAGIERHEAAELVRLAEVEPPRLLELVDKVEAEGRRPTPWSVLRALAADGAAEGRGDSDECYTPQAVIDLAVEVFGGRPDCDPATSAVAQHRVGAGRWWSQAEPELGDAEKAAGLRSASLRQLLRTWAGCGTVIDGHGEVLEGKAANAGRLAYADQLAGKVWCNPPYSCPRPWILAIVEGWLGQRVEVFDGGGKAERIEALAGLRARSLHVEREGDGGQIREALLLLNVATGTSGQQLLLATAQALCFPDGRLGFDGADGKPIGSSNRYEQVIAYYGQHAEVFAAVFGRVGQVLYGAHWGVG